MAEDGESRQPLPAEIGEVIGGYCLDDLISRGGMGCVYKASHAVLARVAAVKVLYRHLAMDEEYIRRFLSEARIVNEVRHANIVDIFDFVRMQDPRRVACIMEYLDGPTLLKSIVGNGLTLTQAVHLALQMSDALSTVHERGVVHRDLKPSNIIVTGDLSSDLSTLPSLKILDFGIAKIEQSGSHKTSPGEVLGTPAYMAPEQIVGDAITPATDVYALGEILYEMLSRRRTFPKDPAKAVKAKLSGKQPPLVLPDELAEPDQIRALVRSCLALDPIDRPSVSGFRDALQLLGTETEKEVAVPKRASDTVRIPQLSPEELPPVTAITNDPFEVAPSSLRILSEPIADPAPVRRLGRYLILEELEPRGITQSYVARREGLVEILRLKRLLQNLESDQNASKQLRREAQIAAYLNHPGIARLIDAGVEEGTFCIATEFILGQSLDVVLDALRKKRIQMPLAVFSQIALQLLDALHYAHNASDTKTEKPLQIIHRDLNPSTITVAFSGDVKISDFGVARACIDDFKTTPGMAIGSLEYMSPEQVLSQPLDHRSDIYTVAAVFYEMLTGEAVVKTGELIETLQEVVRGSPHTLQKIRSDVPATAAEVIAKGLAKDKNDRWQSAEAFGRALGQTIGVGTFTDEVSDFIRRLLPEEEEKALALLARIRAIGDQTTGAEGQDVREPRPGVEVALGDPEPVMTMPGVVVTPPVGGLPAPPPQKKIVLAGVVLVAVMLGVLAVISVRSSDPVVVASTDPTSKTTAPKDPPTVTVKPQKRVAPRVITTTVAVPKKEAKKKEPRRPPESVKKKEPRRPPKKKDPPKREVPYRLLRQAMVRLKASPKDPRLFDEVHAAIRKASRALPQTVQRRVKVDLDAAERTFSVAPLQRALNKMILAQRQSRPGDSITGTKESPPR